MYGCIRSSQPAHTTLSTPLRHGAWNYHCQPAEIVLRLRNGRYGNHGATVCCAQASELAAPHPTAPQGSITEAFDHRSVRFSTGSWDVEAISSMCGDGGEVPDAVLGQLEGVVHTLTFKETLQVYVQLSKVRSLVWSRSVLPELNVVCQGTGVHVNSGPGGILALTYRT